MGISKASIVRDDEALATRVRFMHERIGTDAIVEEFIPGREIYVGVLGNDRLEAFPLWELCIPGLAEGAPNIATRRVKWDVAYQKRMQVKNGPADLPEELDRAVREASKATYRALSLSGFARLDFRLRPDGRFYLLEANPNPDLTFGEDFADSAEAAGLSYDELIQRIVELGQRYPAAWKAHEG